MKTYRRYIITLVCLLFLSGCGGQAPEEEQEKLPQGPAVTMLEDGSGKYLRVDKTVSLEIEDPEGFTNKNVYSGSYGSELYLLTEYRFEGDAEPAMWMYIYDLDTQETVKSSFSLELPDMEILHMYSMAVTGENELTFRLYGTVGEKAASVYLCRTDLTGKPLDEENPVSDDTGYPPDTGRFFALPDGTCILAEAGESMEGSLYRYDAQSQTPTALATVNGIVTALCSDGQGGLYYVNSEQLRYLNLADMTDERVFNTAEYGIRLTFDNWLLCGKEGSLAIGAVNADNTVVYLLTDQEETIEREEIRMVRIGLYGPLFWRADEWSAKSDTYRIVKEEIDESKLETNLVSEYLQAVEPLRTRTMAELASGQGPELMIVSKDDMHILAEKGALMDMSELIPEDIQEQLFPGVRQIGTVDGQWVGITDSVFCHTLMTADSLWSEDDWTVSEMLDLADSRDDWGDWILSFFDTKPNYNWLFEWGFATSIGDSPFLDLENGISYFNGEEFIRALEFCKKYGQPNNAVVEDYEELYHMLLEEKSLAQVVYLYDGLHSFSKKMASYENCHMVGYPGETGSGNYMYADTFLVVNADAEHVDAIRDYITYLLDYETQLVNSTPVRRDALRDQVGDDPNFYPAPYTLAKSLFHEGYDPWPLEDLKPDGTTYLEEYLDFMESCEAVPYCPDAIINIVKEEIDAYFTGNRSAKDTADIIHRRVQNYLDERN